MRTDAVQTGTDPVQDRTIHGQSQYELALSYDITTQRGAEEYARELARRTVMAEQVDTRTVDGAIHIIERRYRLGSFVRRLWKGLPVVIRVDRLERLKLAHEDAIRRLRGRWA